MLEIFKKLRLVDGHTVSIEDEIRELDEVKFAEVIKKLKANHIKVDLDGNTIQFLMQKGPAKHGVNGCSMETILEAVRSMLLAADREFPTENYKEAILSVKSAMDKIREG